MPCPPLERQPQADDFRLVKKIGEGSYSQVWLAVEKQTGFICALKVLNKQSMREQQLEDVLIREIKVHTYLKHKNIIDLYGYF